MKKISYKKTIELITFKNAYYVRVRDIADLFDIKQPYEFFAFLRKKKCNVLSGDKTEQFRDKNLDSSRTIFMKLSELLAIIKKEEKNLAKVARNYNSGIATIEKAISGKEFEL